MSTELVTIPDAPNYLAALMAQYPELATINQEALSGTAKPMPPTIVADKGHFVKKQDGTEETILFPDNAQNKAAGIVGMPVPMLQAVVLRAKPGKEKAYYVSKYVPGQETQSPDCFSDDGTKPDPSSRLKQCDNCASCPQNVFGSATNDSGEAKGKACSDRKVLAIFANGGAYRFAVPPASLKSWDAYCNSLSAKGISLPAVITVIGFEHGDTSYKLTFSFGGMLAEAQLGKIVGMLKAPEVMEIISPRSAQTTLPAPTTTQQDNVVDDSAAKAAADATAKKVADAATKKAAKEKKDAEDKAKAAQTAAASTGGDLGLDLGGVELGTSASDVSPDDAALIDSLGL